MTFLKKILRTFFIGGLLIVAIAAKAEPLKIVFWHSMTGEKGRHLGSIVADFNRSQEGQVQVEAQFVGSYDDGLNKLRTAVIAGRPPQVVQITDVGTALMIDSQAIVPLQSFIDQDPEFPLKELLPAIRRYYEVKGVLYSLPFATSNPILYYNADMLRAAGLERAPATFAELETYADRLTNKEKKIYGLTWPLHAWLLEEFLAKQGAPLITPNNGRLGPASEANYLASESRVFMDLWARMVKKGTFANLGRGWDAPSQNFLAARTAMFITSTSDMFEVFRNAPFKLGTAPIPSGPGENRGGTVVGGNSLWIMKSKSRESEKAAYAFVKFMAGIEPQKKWHTNTGYFPIRNDVIESLKAEGFYQRYPVAWTAIEQVRSSPESIATQGALTPVFQLAREHMMTAIEEILTGHSDFDAAMKKAKSKTDVALARDARARLTE
jgi:sn-glycerol 3-phosphate transport system substrate-binding protein